MTRLTVRAGLVTFSHLFRKCLLLLGGTLFLAVAGAAQAGPTYTQDPNLPDFASPSTTFATLSNYTGGDVGGPYTPTFATLSAGLRVFGGTFTASGLPTTPAGQNWILVTFAGPVSAIRVFPNIDHFGSAYDGYQYQIYGSNSLSGPFTALFDALTVIGSGEPFTLGTFTGTAPTVVNNVLTPGAGPGGTVGYEADFSFGTAYRYYAFGASTEAFNAGNADQELSAVSAGIAAVPEPGTSFLFATGLLGLLAYGRRRRR
jgi:hypothetical protein